MRGVPILEVSSEQGRKLVAKGEYFTELFFLQDSLEDPTIWVMWPMLMVNATLHPYTASISFMLPLTGVVPPNTLPALEPWPSVLHSYRDPE